MNDYLPSLRLSKRFTADLLDNRLTASERSAVKKSLELLDSNEHHPSLRIHRLEGDPEGSWTAYVTMKVRITFRRDAGGLKQLLTLTMHYDR